MLYTREQFLFCVCIKHLKNFCSVVLGDQQHVNPVVDQVICNSFSYSLSFQHHNCKRINERILQ